MPWARAGLAAINKATELKLPPLVATLPVNSDKVDSAVAIVNKASHKSSSRLPSSAAPQRSSQDADNELQRLVHELFRGRIDPLFTAQGRISGIVVSQVVPSPRSTAVPIVNTWPPSETSDQTPSMKAWKASSQQRPWPNRPTLWQTR
jgi:hypothetical protein